MRVLLDLRLCREMCGKLQRKSGGGFSFPDTLVDWELPFDSKRALPTQSAKPPHTDGLEPGRHPQPHRAASNRAVTHYLREEI